MIYKLINLEDVPHVTKENSKDIVNEGNTQEDSIDVDTYEPQVM